MRSNRSFLANAGFTLIEVMISLTIMAMVTAVAFSGLSVGLESWRRGSRKIDHLERRAIVERLLSRQLALAYPLEFVADRQSFVLFRGSSGRLEFIANYSLVEGQSDYRKIDYLAERGHFRYGERLLYGTMPTDEETAETQEVAVFSRIMFRYLSRTAGGQVEWIDEWWDRTSLPRAVQVQIDDDVFVVPLVYGS